MTEETKIFADALYEQTKIACLEWEDSRWEELHRLLTNPILRHFKVRETEKWFILKFKDVDERFEKSGYEKFKNDKGYK